jgi:hypothetical protein
MVDRDKIQFDLIKLANGGRILCLTEPQSSLSLEKNPPSRPPCSSWFIE